MIPKKVIPLADMVLIRRVGVEPMTKGGLWKPETLQKHERGFRGELLAKGPDCKTTAEVGQWVLFEQVSSFFDPQLKELDQFKNMILVREKDLFAVLE
jgi:co-chaperonin GroES (HSP10)